jgi:hypothetical protein
MSADAAIEGLDRPWETLPPGEGRAESALLRLTIAGKPFFILRQRGTLQQMAYDHGRLLATEIEAGALAEIASTVARSIDLGNDLFDAIAGAVFRAVSDTVQAHVSDEFRGAASELFAGYTAAATTAGRRFAERDFLDAAVAIEVDNLVEGISRQMQIPVLRVATALKLAALAVPRLRDRETSAFVSAAGRDAGRQATLRRVLERMSNRNNRCDFSCTGFIVPGALTDDGRLLHARTLDADLYSWNQAPVLVLVDETGAAPHWHRYAAFGTAGLLYPGGISGINDAGISVSLHQLSTTRYDLTPRSGRADLAPFLQQRILREAGSLSDAIDIVRDAAHFAAWIIVCADAKTGAAMRFEFNGETIAYGRPEAVSLAQANHFLDPRLEEQRFDENDHHFTPSFGKWLETHARFALVDDALGRLGPGAPAGIDWAIDLLASGRDWNLTPIAARLGLPVERAGERSYGRGPRKIYGQMASIVRGDPERRNGHDEVWMTVGERLPGCMSTYAGWRIDWDALSLTPVAERPLRRSTWLDRNGRGRWQASLESCLSARLAIARPRDAAGRLLMRRSTDAETAAAVTEARQRLTLAISEAAADGIVEPPYHFLRARLSHQAGDYAAAKADWDLLRAVWARQQGAAAVDAAWPVASPEEPPLLHDYEAALVLALAAVTEDNIHGHAGWPGRDAWLDEARALLQGLKDALFAGRRAHFDLERWIERIAEIGRGGVNAVDLPDPSFVTVE